MLRRDKEVKRSGFKNRGKPLKKSTKPISKQSPRRKKLDAEYHKKVKAWKKENPICQVCKIRATVDCHHIRGRSGYLIDAKNWLPACRECHNLIETERGWAKRMGYLVYGVEGK